MVATPFLRHSGRFVLATCMLALAGRSARVANAQVVNASGIKVTYRCGNYFRVRNFNTVDVPVQYSVFRTTETGPLTLPAAITGIGYSETWLRTTNRGAVRLAYLGGRVAEKPNGNAPCAVLFTQGQWTDTLPWLIMSIHAHLLPNGKVLSYGREHAQSTGYTIPPGKTEGIPTVWDPVARTFTQHDDAGDDLFCSGHGFTKDGKLVDMGGHDGVDASGQRYTHTFDYISNTWTRTANMAAGRWYPTVTALSTGELLVTGGSDTNRANNVTPEVYDPVGNTFRQLTGAQRGLDYFPFNFVAPNATNGTVFYAGDNPNTFFMRTAGVGSIGLGIPTALGVGRDYGSAVMYDAGKIIIMGGGNTQASAEVIDLNQASPSWRATTPMHLPRRQMNAVILANGQVMASGGSAGAGFNPATNFATIAEIWDPLTEQWTQVADAKIPRLYHSETLLLPDATVLSVGSGQPAAAGLADQYNYQIFTPPYLFNPDGTPATASRPVITSAPASVGYGQNFTVNAQGAAGASVLWVRLGSVTHAFNQSQRLNHLPVSQSGGTLTVTAPATNMLAPPGFYLLFVVNSNGVPSAGKIVQIQ